MSREAMPATGAATVGEYHGRATRRLTSDHLWVEALATAGPRIVRLGLAGSDENLLAETPDVGWETPNGRYELFGGHRLWVAPEDPVRGAVPDGEGLAVAVDTSGIRLTGAAESSTELIRSIELRLDPASAAIELRHELCNVGDRPIELAPWAITQLPLGGVVMLPQARAIEGHKVRPNRMLVLWPYTSWEDGRFEPHDGLMLVRAEAGAGLKLGYFNEAGWVGYLRRDVLLLRRFQPAIGRRHPDLGCNVETYCGDRFLELELLGPLADLAPGATVVQTERWEVLKVEDYAEAGRPAWTGEADGDEVAEGAVALAALPGGSPRRRFGLSADVRDALARVS